MFKLVTDRRIMLAANIFNLFSIIKSNANFFITFAISQLNCLSTFHKLHCEFINRKFQ